MIINNLIIFDRIHLIFKQSSSLRIRNIHFILQQGAMESISNFIHSQDFWKWHGFTLSVLWLFGSSIGVYLKKKNVTLHLLMFILVDYLSLFFMGAALYLVLPKFAKFFQWNLLQCLHVVSGIIFMVLMTIQHVGGAVSWHKSTKNYGHRKLGTKLVIFGRILAAVGWLIQQQNKIYSIAVVLVSLLMYSLAERTSWSKIKTS